MARRIPVFAILPFLLSGMLFAEGVLKTLRIPRGKTAVTVAGDVLRGDRDRYELTAGRGQTMTVLLTAREKNAAFTIYLPGFVLKREDGLTLPTGSTLSGAGEGEDAMSWTGPLPASGKYLIEVGGTRGNASYRLTVTIR